jgi:uncharacterized delta-60 repeat protein
MKRFFSLAAVVTFGLVACQITPQPENTPYRLLGSLEVSIGETGLQSTKFTPSRLGVQGGLVSDNNLQFVTAAFAVGTQTTPAAKFYNAKFTVKNSSGAAINNLTLVAAHRMGNTNSTALKNITNFNNVGIPAYAQNIKPAHGMLGNGTVSLSANNEDLMLLTEAEISQLTTVAGATLQAGEYLLPYGFVARNSTTLTSRSIPSNTSTATGLINAGFRTDGTNEPSAVNTYLTFTALVFDNPSNTTRVAESLEEQGGTQVNTRKTSISAKQIIATHDSLIMSVSDVNQVNVCRVRTAGTTASPATFLSSTSVTNTAGTLNVCFGAGGKRTYDFSSGTELGNGMTRDSKGRFVVAGTRTVSAVQKIFVMRFNQDGSLDSSFGTDGSTTLTSTVSEDAKAVVTDSSDNIYIAANRSGDILVVKLDSTGALDSTFGTSGKFSTTVGSLNDSATAIALDSSNRVVVVGGMTQSGGLSDSVVLRLTTAGALDTSFNTTGILTYDMTFNDIDNLAAVTIDSSNRIVVAGIVYVSQFANNFAVARINANGTFDTTFNTDGKATINFNGTDFATGIVIDSSNRIVVTGNSDAGTRRFVATRLTNAGLLDTTFGTNTVPNGIAQVSMTDFSLATSTQLDSNGRIIIVGSNSPTASTSDFAAIRLTTSGVLDTTFGTSGKAIIPFGTGVESARASALDESGNIVLMGETVISGTNYGIGLVNLHNP